jgi:kynureninase
MVCLKAALELLDRAGIENLRLKSVHLTAYLEFLLGKLTNIDLEIITPGDPAQRGAQLSLFIRKDALALHQAMISKGIVVDYRQPGVIRVAPAPIYNSYEDVFRFYEILRKL